LEFFFFKKLISYIFQTKSSQGFKVHLSAHLFGQTCHGFAAICFNALIFLIVSSVDLHIHSEEISIDLRIQSGSIINVHLLSRPLCSWNTQ
jgi:hypothetical protein